MKRKHGFTLIELLITVTILSILVGVLLPNLTDLRKKARDQRRKSDLSAIANALELYKLGQSPPSYPETIPESGASWEENGVIYIRKMPTDPLNSANSDKYNYRYVRSVTNPLSYQLQACLEMKNDPDISGAAIDDSNCDFYTSGSNIIYQWFTRSEP